MFNGKSTNNEFAFLEQLCIWFSLSIYLCMYLSQILFQSGTPFPCWVNDMGLGSDDVHFGKFPVWQN